MSFSGHGGWKPPVSSAPMAPVEPDDKNHNVPVNVHSKLRIYQMASSIWGFHGIPSWGFHTHTLNEVM